MARPWEANPDARFDRRLGKTAEAIGASRTTQDCPVMYRLNDGDVAVVGRDMTETFADRLPDDVRVGPDERLVVIPGGMLASAKPDIPDA